MIFPTRLNGIPCKCNVLTYNPGTPAQTSGPPEMCDPGDPEEFEFEILDCRGRRAAWLDCYLSPAVEQQLLEEAHVMRQAEAYEYA